MGSTVNQLTLKQIILEYPGGSNGITGVFKLWWREGSRWAVSEWSYVRRTWSAVSGFAGGKKEPLVKESRQPSKARKGKKMNFPLEPLQRTPGPTDIFMFIQWDPFGLLTSRYESEYICIVLSYLVCGNLL